MAITIIVDKRAHCPHILVEMAAQLRAQLPDVFDLILARLDIELMNPAARIDVAEDPGNRQAQQIFEARRPQRHALPLDEHNPARLLPFVREVDSQSDPPVSSGTRSILCRPANGLRLSCQRDMPDGDSPRPRSIACHRSRS